MDIHELKLMNFDEAVERLEDRLVEIRKVIDDNKSHAAPAAVEALGTSKSEAQAHLARLREMKAAEMSGERDNLLTEVASLLDQIGKRISDLFPNA